MDTLVPYAVLVNWQRGSRCLMSIADFVDSVLAAILMYAAVERKETF